MFEEGEGEIRLSFPISHAGWTWKGGISFHDASSIMDTSHQRLAIASCKILWSCFYNPFVGFNPTLLWQDLTADQKGVSLAWLWVGKDRVMLITWASCNARFSWQLTIESRVCVMGIYIFFSIYIRRLRSQRKKKRLWSTMISLDDPAAVSIRLHPLGGSRNRHHYCHHCHTTVE